LPWVDESLVLIASGRGVFADIDVPAIVREMGRVSRWAAIAWLATFLLGGCAGEDYRYPSEGCQEYIDTWCDQNAACVAPSEKANDRETCEFASKLSLDCSKVVQLSPNYQGCIDALHATTCDGYTREKGIPFPDVCKGVLIHD
jgi:hypothetical protein